MRRPALSTSAPSEASLEPGSGTDPGKIHDADIRQPAAQIHNGLNWDTPSNSKDSTEQASEEDENIALELQSMELTDAQQLSRSSALQRWTMAVGFITEANQVNRFIKVLQNKHAPPADRFYAAVNLSNYLLRGGADVPHRMLLHYHITKRRLQHFNGMWDRLDTELYVLGSQVFELLTPAQVGQHWIVFTVTMLFIEWIVFFFMAGQYPYYQLNRITRQCAMAATKASPEAGLICASIQWPTPSDDWHGIVEWISKRDAHYDFSFNYLRQWGGRYGPDIAKGDALRWVTSSFVHANFMHVLANMLLFMVLSNHVEHKYGTTRAVFIYFVTVLGANFLSVALEDPCLQVVGASGGIFGLFGLYMADMMVNFESIQQPFMRTVCTVAFMIFFLYTAFTEKYVSHISHIGGLTCGLLLSFLILPQLKRRARWEWAMAGLGVACVLGIFLALPVWMYQSRLHGLQQLCDL